MKTKTDKVSNEFARSQYRQGYKIAKNELLTKIRNNLPKFSADFNSNSQYYKAINDVNKILLELEKENNENI